MKGYFSRIAKQSGLRFSGQEGLRPFAASETSVGFSPIHREETVMIPPSSPGERGRALPETKRAANPEVPQRQASVANTGQKSKQRVREEMPVRTVEKTEKEPVLKEQRMVSPPALAAEYKTLEDKEYNTGEGKTPVGYPVVEQPVVAETERSGETAQATEPKEAKEPLELKNSEAAEASPPVETEKKDYFSKTVEIIEKGEAGPADIQNILFQEVQEWVAGSPATVEMTDPGPEDSIETIVGADVLRPRPPDLVTLRDVRAENIERAELREQTFDLSIGTISVIIEESEKLRQPEPPAQQNNKAAVREPEHRFSRLNRNYL